MRVRAHDSTVRAAAAHSDLVVALLTAASTVSLLTTSCCPLHRHVILQGAAASELRAAAEDWARVEEPALLCQRLLHLVSDTQLVQARVLPPES